MGGLQQGAVMFPWALSEANPQTRAQVLSHLPPPPGCSTGPSGSPLPPPHPRRYDHHTHSNDYPPVPGEAIMLGATGSRPTQICVVQPPILRSAAPDLLAKTNDWRVSV
jgi:hypothetical protein